MLSISPQKRKRKRKRNAISKTISGEQKCYPSKKKKMLQCASQRDTYVQHPCHVRQKKKKTTLSCVLAGKLSAGKRIAAHTLLQRSTRARVHTRHCHTYTRQTPASSQLHSGSIPSCSHFLYFSSFKYELTGRSITTDASRESFFCRAITPRSYASTNILPGVWVSQTIPTTPPSCASRGATTAWPPCPLPSPAPQLPPLS